jgi:nucleotide-binding universal stress UspA family protein
LEFINFSTAFTVNQILNSMYKNNEKRIIERILVPIDFSAYSLNACYFALHLSARQNAEIILFHAFFNPMADAMTFPDAFTYQSNMAEVFHELEQNARRETDKFKRKIKRYAKLKKLENVKIKTEVAAGQPGIAIENSIKSFEPELVIIGTRGHGKRSNEVLGSVAGKVIDLAGIPVLLVTQDAVLNENRPIKVLYATNFDESDSLAIESLLNILSGYSTRIECVHFSADADAASQKVDMEKISELKGHFNKNYPGISLNCHIIEKKDILEGLNHFVDDADIDLIALTHKKRNLFYRLFNPSLAKKLLFQTKRPVFVFN